MGRMCPFVCLLLAPKMLALSAPHPSHPLAHTVTPTPRPQQISVHPQGQLTPPELCTRHQKRNTELTLLSVPSQPFHLLLYRSLCKLAVMAPPRLAAHCLSFPLGTLTHCLDPLWERRMLEVLWEHSP